MSYQIHNSHQFDKKQEKSPSRIDVNLIDGILELHRKRTMRYLGVAEIVLGCNCMLLGGASITLKILAMTNFDFPLFFVLGEGLWCGLIITIAGISGVLAGKPNSSSLKIKLHFGLSITAAFFAMVLFILQFSPTVYLLGTLGSFVLIPQQIMNWVSFLSMILLIASACLCGCQRGNCCCEVRCRCPKMIAICEGVIITCLTSNEMKYPKRFEVAEEGDPFMQDLTKEYNA